MKGCFLFLFWMISFFLKGQNTAVLNIGKLTRELTEAKDDSTRALLMTQLAEAYRDRSSDTCFNFGQQALDLSRSINYAAGEAKSLLVLSHYFFNRGNLTTALELGFRALGIAEKNNLRYDHAFAMIRIGNAYMGLKDYPEALSYFLKTKKLTENSPDSFFYAVTFWRAADAFAEMNLIDSSLAYAKKAEDTALGMGNNFILRGIAPTLGYAYFKKGNDSLALRYYRFNSGGHSSLNLALYYIDRGPRDSALFYAHRAYQASQANNVKDLELASAEVLSGLYENTDPEKAIHYYKIVLSAKDSLYGAEKVSAAKTISFAEKERKNKLLMDELAYKNKIKIIGTLSGLALAFLVALILFFSYRKGLKANSLLQHQKNELTQALSDLKKVQSQLIQSEKMASLGELTAGIAHEIQNPLNFVNNFSEINTELSDEILEAITIGDLEQVKVLASGIKSNQEKIVEHGKRADNIVKSMLQHSRSSSSVKEPTDLNKLADEYLRLAYHGLRAKDKSFNANIKTVFDNQLPLLPVMAQDIGRVLLNLYNNAFFAVKEKQNRFPDGFEPEVTVSSKNNDDKIEIRVKDNGMGIPEKIKDKIFQPFFTTKPTGQGTGLGLSLSYDIIKSHGGELRMESKVGEGSEFILQLPIELKRK